MTVPINSSIRVSYKAVCRYIQIIMGITLGEEIEALDPLDRAEAYCAAAGLTIREVQSLIYTPGVQLAVSMGMPSVTTGAMNVWISPLGVITTINAAVTHDQKRLRILSDREYRQQMKNLYRRLKRRPVGQHLASFEDIEGEQS